jgi:hypothetical protein
MTVLFLTFVEEDWQGEIVERMLTYPKSYGTLTGLIYQSGR